MPVCAEDHLSRKYIRELPPPTLDLKANASIQNIRTSRSRHLGLRHARLKYFCTTVCFTDLDQIDETHCTSDIPTI